MTKRTCSIDGCENIHKGHGYCKKHLTRLKVHGDPLYVYQNQQTKPCTVDGCSNLIRAKGLCNAHYKRAKDGREMSAPIEVRLQSAADRLREYTEWNGDCLEWTGARLPKGYGIIAENGRNAYAHRVSWELANGPVPDGMQVDHICGNTSCVNPSHLRPVTPKQNQEHKVKLAKNNSSGFRGVHWDASRNQWVGQVKHHGKLVFVGRYSTREEANAETVALRNLLFTHNDLDRAA